MPIVARSRGHPADQNPFIGPERERYSLVAGSIGGGQNCKCNRQDKRACFVSCHRFVISLSLFWREARRFRRAFTTTGAAPEAIRFRTPLCGFVAAKTQHIHPYKGVTNG